MANHFPDKSGESVLIQSQTGTNSRSPEFRQVVQSVVSKLEATRHVRNVESPYAEGNQGTLSADGKSALVSFEIPGDDGEDKVDAPPSTRSPRSTSRPASGSRSSATPARTRR